MLDESFEAIKPSIRQLDAICHLNRDTKDVHKRLHEGLLTQVLCGLACHLLRLGWLVCLTACSGASHPIHYTEATSLEAEAIRIR